MSPQIHLGKNHELAPNFHDILKALYRPQSEAVSVARPDGRPSHVWKRFMSSSSSSSSAV
jgi:hypothetical protein